MSRSQTKPSRAKRPVYRPILQLPPLPPEQYEALRSNIAVNGVLVAITTRGGRGSSGYWIRRLVPTMPTKKRRTAWCFSEPKSGCGVGQASDLEDTPDEALAVRVFQILADQKATASSEEQVRLVDYLSRSIRRRKVVAQRWSRNRHTDDIIGLIQISRDAGDLDEAIWRCFLAAHFGRASAKENRIGSASDFLCAFGDEPYWTWQRVCDNPDALRKWLHARADDLQSLSFGNHRKYESKQPGDIWKAIESFLTLADEHGGSVGLVDASKCAVAGRFDALYRRLSRLWRFGRTGRFDFLELLIDLRLLSAEPVSCYLPGATGPLKGAKRLWGNLAIGDLDRLAADLARQLRVSPMAVEDALCNWQK